MRTRTAALTLILLWSAQGNAPASAEESIIDVYRSYRLLTPEPIAVSPTIVALCIPPSEELLALERLRTGPHFNGWVKLYANTAAVAGFEAASAFPVGAVVVKEKLAEGGSVSGVGGMRKREPGYDAPNGDWEYFYSDRSAASVYGRIANCIACHTKAKATDYVYTRPERWR
jgi:cytochrome P460